MAKLKDLVNVNINRDVIFIQGVEFPVMFTMSSFEYVVEAYGNSYPEFEKNMHEMMQEGKMNIMNADSLKLMRSLIYAMVRSGGTETTPDELEGAIPMREVQDIFVVVLSIFTNQKFQTEDLGKIKTEKK